MPETMTEVKSFIIRYTCDKCGKGEMVGTGIAYPVQPPLYEYECLECGHKMKTRDRYPRTEYESVTDCREGEQESEADR
jgi:predicted nucleic acid-binding Zn ribbon protein